MKTLSPAHITAALVLSLSAGTAFAAAGSITTSTTRPVATTTASTGTGTTTAGVSSTSTGTTGTGTNTIGTTTTLPTTTGLPTAPVSATSTAGGGTNTSNANATTTTTTVSPTSTTVDTGTPSQASFGRDTSFANDSGNAALFTAPGQTSTGTFAGNSTIGIPAGADTLAGSNGVINGTVGTNPVGTTGAFIGGTGIIGTAGAVVPGSNVAVNVNPASSVAAPRTPTPTYDQAAQHGLSQVEREARSGRVYGQAPRTNNDRTSEMPDDPIIRY